ncbi:hydroxycarboxylic acid receptor 2-like [Amia ocellicauda]|uniref:hydroxycarboxylic acid receptor 2-like n=1 Tax=Amia ocellicauda TaxID=2972642 RepID=UPI00346385A1
MENSVYNCSPNSNWLSQFLKPALIIEFIIGSVGNGVALWIFCFRVKSWKASTVYLVNLALADFLLIFCLPFRTDYYFHNHNWVFGDAGCRVMLFMVSLNRAGSIVFLSVIAIDRFFKVVYPHHTINTTSSRGAAKISCLMWGLCLAMTAYLAAEPQESQQNATVLCESFKLEAEIAGTQLWHVVFFIAEFFIPLVVIVFCTISISHQLRTRGMENNQKIRKALMSVQVVTVVFVLCFLPSTLSLIVLMIVKSMKDCTAYWVVGQVFYGSLALTYFNSMLDPIVYYFSSPMFRNALKSAGSRQTGSAALQEASVQNRRDPVQETATPPCSVPTSSSS